MGRIIGLRRRVRSLASPYNDRVTTSSASNDATSWQPSRPAGEVGVEALCQLGLLPHTTGQVYTVHLIRTSMRLVSYSDRSRVATALRPICTAATAAAA